jgi:tripartite-type tricarboxylate transporter receptor subunit TctC
MRHHVPGLGRRPLLAGIALTAFAAGASRAQEPAAWPTGPLRLVVPFPPGSTPDLVARLVADHLREAFRQPVVVDNRAGAGGTLGTALVASATDGHTIGVTINGPVTTAKALYPSLPYDPARDLALVSLLARTPQLLAVHPGVPATDLAALVAHAKANPGRMSFGSVGPGSASHLAMEDLKARAGIDLAHVPYKGFPEATVDLVAGRIQAMFVIASGILPQVRAGSAKALAVTADARIPQAPEVPTLAEAGLPDAASYAWNGLVAPAATPPDRVARLAAEARAAVTAPANRATLEKAGFEIVGSGPAEFAAFAAAETERWTALVRRLGITLGG